MSDPNNRATPSQRASARVVATGFVLLVVLVSGLLIAHQPQGYMRAFAWVLWAGFVLLALVWVAVGRYAGPVVVRPAEPLD